MILYFQYLNIRSS